MRDLFTSSTAGAARTPGITTTDFTARLVDPPAEVARLSSGQFLRGQVLGQDEAGLMIVQTRLAIVKLAVARNLAVGSEVVLQIRPGGPQSGVTLLPLDAAPPQQPAPPAGGEVGGPRGAGHTPALPLLQVNLAQAIQSTALSSDFITRASLIRAILQTAPPLPLLAGLPSADPGTELLLRVLSIGSPGQSAGPSVAGGSPGASPSVPGTAPAAPPIGAAPIGAPPAGVTSPPGNAAGIGKPAAQVAKPTLSGTPPATTTGPVTAPPGGPSLAKPWFQGPSPQNPGAPVAPTAGQTTQIPTAPPVGTPVGTPEAGLRLAPQATVISAGRSAAAALQSLTPAGVAQAIGTAAGQSSGGAVDSTAGDGSAVRLTGLVTAKSSGGPTILHTPLGTLTLKAAVDLPAGTSLALEVLLPSNSKPPLIPAGFATAWPGSEMVKETLLAGLPGPQAEALQRALPQVGPRLGSGMLFFLSAITQGNPLGWLAGPAAALERGERGEFLDRLGRELAGLSRSVETSSGEWRLLQLPIWSDEGLRELRLFLRQQDQNNDADDNEAGDKATRFVLELELRQHGALQLDGLVRPQHFDLILRSRRRLPAVTRGDLLALFEETNAIAGYRGQLLFQTSQDWMQLLSAQPSKKEAAGLEV